MSQPKKIAKSKIAASTTIQNKPTLQAIKKEVGGRTYSKPLLVKLGKEGVKTLVDIRQKGGLGELEGLTEKQQAAARKLEAHAYLNLISEDTAVNENLIHAIINKVSESEIPQDLSDQIAFVGITNTDKSHCAITMIRLNLRRSIPR